MTIVHNILGRFFLTWVLVLIGFSGLFLVFDMLANTDAVLKYHPTTVAPLAQYAVLRVQQIILFVLPLSVLFSVIILLTRMVVSQEIIIYRAVGISVYRVLLILSGAVTLIVLLHSVLANTVLVKTNMALRQWQSNDYKGAAEYTMRDIMSEWVSEGPVFLHAENISSDGKRLDDVVILERNADNMVTYYLYAKSATYDNGMWLLQGVIETHADNSTAAVNSDTKIITLPFEPKALSFLNLHENELGYGDILELIASDHGSTSESKPYRFWFHHKIAVPFSSFVMLFLAAPVALQLARRDKLLITSFICIMAGFVFYVFQQLLASMGETAILPPFLAAWTPILLGLTLGNWVLLHFET